MKKLWIALLTMLFVIAWVGTALSEAVKTYEPDFELVFKGPLSSEYIDKNSVCFIDTKNGVDTDKVAAWVKIEYTPDGVNNRIFVYKKNYGNSTKYDQFLYSYNCIIYDMKNNKYATLRFVDFDRNNNILNESKKSINDLRWSNLSDSRSYTIDVLQKYIALNYDIVLARSTYNKKSD
jgi:nucleoside-specific outer membrane channel protein Tsx